MSDLLGPSRELVKEPRLRANSSSIMRGNLELLISMNGAIWERLGLILEEVQRLRVEQWGHQEVSGDDKGKEELARRAPNPSGG